MIDVVTKGLSEICLLNNFKKSSKEIQVIAELWCEDFEEANEYDKNLIEESLRYFRRNYTKWPLPADILEIADKLRSETKLTPLKSEERYCSLCSDWFQPGFVYAIDDKGYRVVGRCSCNNNPLYKSIPLLTDEIIAEKGWRKIRSHKHRKGICTPGYQYLVKKFWEEGRSNDELRAAGEQVQASYLMAKDNGYTWFQEEDEAGMTAWLDKIYGVRERVRNIKDLGFSF